MRILLVHNAYQQRGGEDVVVEAEASLLRAAGYVVDLQSVYNDDIVGLTAKVKTFARTAYNSTSARWISERIGVFKPNIVHVHNFFPLLSPSIHEAAASTGVGVVQTLHNYRLFCAGAQFLRNNSICEKCIGGNYGWGVYHRCFRGSLPGSMAVALMQERARRTGVWRKSVHTFIALTQFAKAKFIEAGLPEDRIAIKPNFVRLTEPAGEQQRSGALYVGRLSPEKGVSILLRAWDELPHIPLQIIGEGPERAVLESMAPSNVTFRGALSSLQVKQEMNSAAVLLMPSIWYEGFPMTLVEAYAAGLPVVGSRIGSIQELIDPGVTGELVNPGDPQAFAATLKAMFSEPSILRNMSTAARRAYLTNYTDRQGLDHLQRIYEATIRRSTQSLTSRI